MERYIKTSNALSLWSESFGNTSNPALLLIMGAMTQGIFWPDDFCHALAKAGFYVIRYDHRDTGKSQGINFSETPYNLSDLAEDALAILDGYAIKQAHIIGLSMGGYIAQLIAINHPDRVNKLVLISSSADQRPYMQATMGNSTDKFLLPAPAQSFLNYITDSIQNPPSTAQQILDNLIQGWQVTYGGVRPFPKEAITQAIQRASKRASSTVNPMNHALATAASAERLEAIKQINAATLVIHGEYDPCLPLAHGHYLAAHIPHAQMKLLAMGHSFQWSWSDEVLACILKFISN